ncbi:hypothetical protein NDU88_000400, partial [Pleurodeles waltl]
GVEKQRTIPNNMDTQECIESSTRVWLYTHTTGKVYQQLGVCKPLTNHSATHVR